MPVYVDSIKTYPQTGLRHTRWSHMATDGELGELHEIAQKIGLKRRWFQDHSTIPHYDLTPGARQRAIQHGAIAVSSMELVKRCSLLFRGYGDD